ncbi:hypothetical protein CDAR_223981 [Caerostris darwini]|uniref:Secreted protein n=1 Tax=Caerostris darwini TaxID=1538125 RepID=A0AAV4WQ81_9ARAC|nr:hypothetical protein CDAR_223981 [Caerostris darwini]
MTHQQFFLYCITAIAHILLLKTLQCASLKSRRTFTAQNITVREWQLHCAPFTAQNITLRRCKVTAHPLLLKTIHYAGANPRNLGYHDDDQTITRSSIRQAARPNRD